VIYWDTSCVLKLYTAESDSLAWQKHALGARDGFAASALMETEMAYALEQKELRGDVRPGGAQALLRILRRDLQAGRFTLCPVGTDVMALAADIAVRCYHAQKPIPLRTLDGLHLATAMLLKCRAVATADRRMQTAAVHLSVPLLAPSA
jgi:predicted nucleic acid-binding protein